jgi:DNA processing protein
LQSILVIDREEHMAITVSDEGRDLLTLSLVPGIGPRLTATLLERFGSAAAALRASVAELSSIPYLTPRLAENIQQAQQSSNTAAELERMERHGVRLIALGSPEYPSLLGTINDPPYLLYSRGALTAADANAVALVGSRHCTDYGRRIAARLSAGLVRAGVTVISGLARGIDAAAHRAALEAGGRTLAVLAGGLSRIYPPEHDELARQVEASGALLTESKMDQEPLAGLFPVRNRIISGLSKVVVLIEAAQKSGALITAHHAADQGRTVMAVPGSVEAASSGGTNELIRKGAVLCRSVEDILEELHGVSAMATAEKKAAAAPAAPPAPTGPPPGLEENQRRIWEVLTEACHLDQLVQRLGLEVPQVSGALMLMEMKKVVRRLPGNRYERC